MDEIIVRPKYSRQTGTQRRRRKETNNEVMSTVFAAKLLIVVVILTVLALCKAAGTPATDYLISKVKVITTSNYDVNKYLLKAASALGIPLPKNTPVQQENTSEEKKLPETQADKSLSAVNADENIPAAETAKPLSSDVQVLYDQEIKQIADKVSMVYPIKGKIASAFGTRTDPLNGTSQFHKGIDIEANMGTSIKAALGGEIIEAGSNPEYDNYIKIKHIDDIVTVYAHCSMITGKVGQKVNQGDVIAKVGDSEGLEGSYLHFEVWKGDKTIDPEKLLNYINQ